MGRVKRAPCHLARPTEAHRIGAVGLAVPSAGAAAAAAAARPCRSPRVSSGLTAALLTAAWLTAWVGWRLPAWLRRPTEWLTAAWLTGLTAWLTAALHRVPAGPGLGACATRAGRVAGDGDLWGQPQARQGLFEAVVEGLLPLPLLMLADPLLDV